MPDMDITTNIKAIEALKCALLSDMAALYESMRKPSRREDVDEPLAGMLLTLYLLAKRLGLDFSQLDEEAAERLRRDILKEDSTPDVHALLRYLSK